MISAMCHADPHARIELPVLTEIEIDSRHNLLPLLTQRIEVFERTQVSVDSSPALMTLVKS